MVNVMTAQGLEKLRRDLQQTRNKLKDVAQRIKDARELGDLSENSEYLEAKNEQAFLLGREAEIEQKIKTAKVVSACSGDKVDVGCRVEVKNSQKGMMTFEIVGSDESDPFAGRISASSPIGGALYGHKVGENIFISTPSGQTEFTILKIEVV